VEFCARRRAEKAEQIDQTVRSQRPNQTKPESDSSNLQKLQKLRKLRKKRKLRKFGPRRVDRRNKKTKSSAAYFFYRNVYSLLRRTPIIRHSPASTARASALIGCFSTAWLFIAGRFESALCPGLDNDH
jgi:hypothetical protein